MKTPADTLSVVVERDIAHPPEKLWRALTEPHLMAEWLMQNDFQPAVGRRFNLRTAPYGKWNGVIDCEVLAMEPRKSLTYSWDSGEGPLRVTSVVTWTLTPTAAGTHLRMEQSGFRSDQPQNFQGAKYGWQQFFANLEKMLARTE
ncbi:MAG TPA: SRPBCC domain-containing protein [Rhizomicrobium sp.]|nr:SRPBCC domain-containing protein [Rhizomicrobium sp.]